MLHRIREEDLTLQINILKFGQLMKHPFIKLLLCSICFKCQAIIEWMTLSFFGSFCSCKRISFDDISQLVVNLPSDGHLGVPFFQGSCLLCRLLEPPLYPFVCSSPDTSIVDIVSYLPLLYNYFEL